MICTGEADRNQTTSISYCIHFHTCSLRASFGVGHRLSYVQSPRDSAMYSQTRHFAFRYTWRFSRHLQCSKHEPCCWSTCLSLRMLKGGRATSIAIRLKNSLQTMSRPHHRRSLIAICFFSLETLDIFGHCVELVPVYAGVIRLILEGIVQCGRELYPCKPESFTKALWEIT